MILRLLLNAVAVFALANVLTGVHLDGYVSAIVVALVLSILNLLVKPLLVILTLPITIITLGLFLLVVNGLIILLADKFIDGFDVDRFFLTGAVKIVVSVKTGILKYQVKSLIVKCLVRLICFKMNITRENVDALNAVVKVDIAKEDYSDKVEKILTDYRIGASTRIQSRFKK